MKPIGVIGGAGPLAGVFFLERLFTKASEEYGCSFDVDFPEVILLSIPFSDMLSSKRDEAAVRRELKQALRRLRENGAQILVIACNTLHLFLEEEEEGLIHLPKLLKAAVPQGEIPLVLCTSTSRHSELHKKFFNCTYPPASVQSEVDRLIEEILKRGYQEEIAHRLQLLIEGQRAKVVVMGCTELSLYTRHLPSCCLLDPLEMAASLALKRSLTL